jgi:hypothetical protein
MPPRVFRSGKRVMGKPQSLITDQSAVYTESVIPNALYSSRKKYASSEEEALRRRVYSARVSEIVNHNLMYDRGEETFFLRKGSVFSRNCFYLAEPI